MNLSALDILFDRLPKLPALPRVVQDLILSLENEDVDLSRLAEPVRHDPAMSACVLRLANSSYFGAHRKVGSIEDAVARIGLDAMRTLVIATGLTGVFDGVKSVDLRPFWHCSLLTAGFARPLARVGRLDAEFAYTAGLMHRLGEVLLQLAFPEDALPALAQMASLSPAERTVNESAQFGVDHCMAGAELARRWQFPAAIQNALAHYADPLCPQAGPFAAIVAIASHCARGTLAGQNAPAVFAGLSAEVLERVVLDEDAILDVLEEAPHLLEDVKRFI